MRTDLSSFSNKWYKPGNPVKRLLWYYVNIVFFNNGLFPFYGLKSFLLRLFGAKVGRGVLIKPGINIKYPWLLEIGDHVWIGEGAWIDNLAKITIGSNACLSQGCYLLTGNHNYSSAQFDLVIKPIVLEEGVWIGARSLVGPGVTCKSHSVLSAGSVTFKDLESYSIYKGYEAIKVKERIINSASSVSL